MAAHSVAGHLEEEYHMKRVVARGLLERAEHRRQTLVSDYNEIMRLRDEVSGGWVLVDGGAVCSVVLLSECACSLVLLALLVFIQAIGSEKYASDIHTDELFVFE